jgi:hypothetical protein
MKPIDSALTLPSSGRPDWTAAIFRSLGVVIGALAAIRLVLVTFDDFGRRFLGNDLNGYIVGARRFLDTGSPYLRAQVAGPWQLQPDSFIHPPVAVLLFIPWVVLPAVLWWVIPLALTTWSVVRLRPAPWAWPVIAACLLWPRTAGIVIAGNSDMWVAAAVGVALAFRLPTTVLIVMKPSYLPLALIGATWRSWWIAAAVIGVVCIPFGALWFDYFAVLRNVTLEPLYSLYNAPYVAIPMVAWAAGSAPARRAPAGTAADATHDGGR